MRGSRGSARSDPVSLLKDQTATWVPELVPVRNRRMLSSPFAFHRGSVAIMAADLARTPTTGILVQLCGDAQLGNFGAYASGDQQLLFDMNDFDETLRGPWEWDVKRLMASLAILGRERGFDDGERATVVRSAAAAYREAMREFAALGALELWYSRLTVADVQQRWVRPAPTKVRRAFERQVAKAMKSHSVPRMAPVAELDGTLELEPMLEKLLSGARASLSVGRRHLLEEFRYADATRTVVDVGAGTQTWVVRMLGIVDDEPLLLQLKQADQSALAPYAGRSRFDNQGQRVAVGQQLMQASSDLFLAWTRGV